jgi:hypothetical protein
MKESKQNAIILAIVLSLVVGVIVLGYLVTPEPIDGKVRVGDVWEHYGTGDPFIKEDIYNRRVIGVKKDFVQYIEDDRDTLSRRINVFKFNSEKIISHVHKKKDSI